MATLATTLSDYDSLSDADKITFMEARVITLPTTSQQAVVDNVYANYGVFISVVTPATSPVLDATYRRPIQPGTGPH